MSRAYLFPGQGSQFAGMGQDLYNNYTKAKELMDAAEEILGFDIKQHMFSQEPIKSTDITQPAIFLHSVVAALVTEDFKPDFVAGHSVGEFSALVANQTLDFEDALLLVQKRADAMQSACNETPGSMFAILGLENEIVKKVTSEVEGVVIPANYNCPGQLVISGESSALEVAAERLKESGAKRVVPLQVAGAFHSPLMNSAKKNLEEAIHQTKFNEPICPIYQNVDAAPHTDIETIKRNLIEQLIAPVKWTQTIQNMLNNGVDHFTECGPGKVLQGLVKKVDREVAVDGVQ